jgi:monoamine oxidase
LFHSWKEDSNTNISNTDEQRVDISCGYGDRHLQQSVGPLFFAGTETAHGSGHMEGAIVAGQRVSEEVLKHLHATKN